MADSTARPDDCAAEVCERDEAGHRACPVYIPSGGPNRSSTPLPSPHLANLEHWIIGDTSRRSPVKREPNTEDMCTRPGQPSAKSALRVMTNYVLPDELPGVALAVEPPPASVAAAMLERLVPSFSARLRERFMRLSTRQRPEMMKYICANKMAIAPDRMGMIT